MRIDVHAHYFPAEYMDCLARLGSGRVERIAFAPGAGVTMDERVELLDRTGVDMQVLSASLLQPDFAKSSDAVVAARLANDLYLDVCRKYRGRFEAFGVVPLPHVGEAITEVGRCLDTLGMVGLTVGCTVAGRFLDDPAFDPFFAELDRRSAVLFLHPVGAGAGPGTADYGLAWMIGAPVEDSVAALRLVLSGLTSRYPNIRVIVPHLGGILPFLLRRLDDAFERQRVRGVPMGIDGPPSIYVRRLWFDTVSSHPAALRCACDSFGADRLMLGSDFPYNAGAQYEYCVKYVKEAGLPEKDTTAILDKNAKTLLGLGKK